MLLIVGTIRLPAEKLDEARPVMQRMIEASRAEDGCLSYSYSQDVLETNVIHVKELWRDRVSLDKHFVSDHIGSGVPNGQDLALRIATSRSTK